MHFFFIRPCVRMGFGVIVGSVGHYRWPVGERTVVMKMWRGLIRSRSVAEFNGDYVDFMD